MRQYHNHCISHKLINNAFIALKVEVVLTYRASRRGGEPIYYHDRMNCGISLRAEKIN